MSLLEVLRTIKGKIVSFFSYNAYEIINVTLYVALFFVIVIGVCFISENYFKDKETQWGGICQSIS
jgi:hypothetical protein